MTRRRKFVHYVSFLPPQRVSRRHKRMLDRAVGFVVYKKRPLKVYFQHRAPVAGKKRRWTWMFSRHLRKYLGCSLRHIYWLILNRRLPYHVYRSSRTPRYIFRREEIDAWLRRYRGKGRQLGLRKLRLAWGSVNPSKRKRRMPALGRVRIVQNQRGLQKWVKKRA